MDQGVMLMTGGALKLQTPNQTLTARDSLEYWATRRMSVARGNAVVTTSDGRRMQADTLVAYSKEDGRRAPQQQPQPQPTGAQPSGAPMGGIGNSGKLQRVEAFGNVAIRTQTDTVMGDRMVYIAETGLARIGGNVRINRGQNQFSGSDALVNTNTGVSQLLAGTSGRVAGIVVPGGDENAAPAETTPATPPARPNRRRQP
jgi:lipopolysaccharide export system protein LptA